VISIDIGKRSRLGTIDISTIGKPRDFRMQLSGSARVKRSNVHLPLNSLPLGSSLGLLKIHRHGGMDREPSEESISGQKSRGRFPMNLNRRAARFLQTFRIFLNRCGSRGGVRIEYIVRSRGCAGSSARSCELIFHRHRSWRQTTRRVSAAGFRATRQTLLHNYGILLSLTRAANQRGVLIHKPAGTLTPLH